MEIQDNQLKRLRELCEDKELDFDSINILLDSVRTKKLFKRINYHQEKIDELIIKSTENEV